MKLKRTRKNARSIIYRLRYVAEAFRVRGCLRVMDVAGELEVSTKTVHRDIDSLRDDFRYDVFFNRNTHRWEVRSLPTPVL